MTRVRCLLDGCVFWCGDFCSAEELARMGGRRIPSP
jgi:hypothetical protein